MSQINTFTADVKDSDGWLFKDAFVAVYDDEKTSVERRSAPKGGDQYETNLQVASLEYYASFWPTKEACEAKLPSKPLINKNPTIHRDENGNEIKELTNDRLFSVDLDHEQSKQIINGGMATEDKTNALEKHDVIRKFA